MNMKKNVVFDPQIRETVESKKSSLIHFVGSIPAILFYQVVTKATLFLIVKLLKELINFLISNLGIVAITNLDIPFLFKSWQGLLILILGLFILVLYTIFDIICTILIADNILHQKKKSIIEIMKEAILSTRYMLHPKAILVILFVSLFAPLTISFFGISLTESFYIPNFIMSVVDANPMYKVPYYLINFGLMVLGYLYLFSFHIMVFRKVNISVAMHTSRVMMTKYGLNCLKQFILFLLKTLLFIALISLVLVVIPYEILSAFSGGVVSRFWLVFFTLHCSLLVFLCKSLFGPFQFMELAKIVESYTIEDEGELIPPPHSLHIRFWSLTLVTYGLIVLISLIGSYDDVFDDLFPLYTVSNVVAHRAGGTLANENTILGLEAAIEEGVYASEIDIQRTKDGHYIVYHDDNFERLCGIKKKPNELTLKQCKELKIIDTFDSTHQDTEMATIEEMLDGAKGKIHLYVELKGATADEKMADDLYQMIIDRDMLEEVTVISLKYNLIDYLENNHPDVQTGYLCFVSLGKMTSLKCDELLLEDEIATSDVIERAHQANKKVYIWTINTEDSMQKRLLDESDGIITDEVKMAERIFKQLSKRDDFSRVIDSLMIYLS